VQSSSLNNAYRRVWETFQRSSSTADGRHDTEQWRSHTGPYAFCIVRVPDSALQPALDGLRLNLQSLRGIRLHPDHFLHITLQELGFVVEAPRRPDEMTPARLEEFAQAAIEPVANARAFRVELGGANSFQDAVFLDVHGGDPLVQLHERLFDLAAIPRSPTYPYLPHCTIAHYDGTPSPAKAAEILARSRNEIFGGLTVSEVEIVTIDPNSPYPEMESYAVIPLGE
jgi:2'-5' RNA ligase